MNITKEESEPEIKISLSPESGSLFHFYHSKLSNTNENGSSGKSQIINSGVPRQFGLVRNSLCSENTLHNETHNNETSLRRKKERRQLPLASTAKANYTYPYGAHKMEKYHLLEMTDHLTAEMEAETHCSKMFHLKDSSSSSHKSWNLPSPESLYAHKPWKVDDLVQLKTDLNSVKSQLDSYDIESWHKHTNTCNPAQKISCSFRNNARPELLTQAFLKLYEMLHTFDMIPDESLLPGNEFKSLHLCEAPGAFIVALNHFLTLHKPNIKWQWIGNTLNPYYEGTPMSECITDDRFILFTLNNWFFGSDGTGNLMNINYLQELKDRTGANINLVTADGSIDCQGNPSEQETTTNNLHFCEVYSALSVLKSGGNFVLKKFTFFEAESVCLMFLISCCFDDVFVYKPITSKLGNSEVYVVAKGFNPSPYLDRYLEILRKFYGQHMLEKVMFSREQVPSSFVEYIVKCCTFFKTHQVEAIKRNIELYEHQSEKNEQYCNLLKCLVLNRFLANIVCRPIETCKKLVPCKLDWDKHITPQDSTNKWSGQMLKKSKTQRLKFLKDQFTDLVLLFSGRQEESISDSFRFFCYSVEESLLDSLEVKEGKPFNLVYVSRFCHMNVIQVYVHYCLEFITDHKNVKLDWEHAAELPLYNSEHFRTGVNCRDDRAIKELKKKHPEAVILRELHYVTPHSCHEAFDELLNLLKDGCLKEGTDVAILNCPLLTRVQNGLLHVFATIFEKVIFFEPRNLLEETPFFVLSGLVSVEKGITLFANLNSKGWRSSNSINQILPLKLLINSRLHSAVCRYNALHCLSNVHVLKSTYI